MTHTRLRRLCAAVLLVVAAGTATAHAVPRTAPAGVRGWLGAWDTNFGQLWFYEVTYSDLTWDNTGAEVSTCRVYRDCRYGWLLRGLWHWPGHGRVPLKAKLAAHGKVDFNTIEPCWLGPFKLEVPGAPGNACYTMLLYRYGDEERGGFWKACFLPENCTDHHHLHGIRVAEHGGSGGLWRLGFRFLQRGRPDGHHVISTQTGGAGEVVFAQDPREPGGAGIAGDNTFAVHIDNLGAAPEPQYTVTLTRGKLTVDHSAGERVLSMAGIVTRSNTTGCGVGASIRIDLHQRDNPRHPDRISLQGSHIGRTCSTDESWTSTDAHRVSVHIGSVERVP